MYDDNPNADRIYDIIQPQYLIGIGSRASFDPVTREQCLEIEDHTLWGDVFLCCQID